MRVADARHTIIRHTIVVALMTIASSAGLGAGAALAQDLQTQGAAPSAAGPALRPMVADAYRGMMVCEQAPGSADILHVPLDIAVRGDAVQFARPLFDPQGARVLGNEMGNGPIDASGAVHLKSAWDVRGVAVDGDYSGTLTAKGGTLTGTQSWRMPDGAAHSRVCNIAVVPAVGARQAAVQP